MFFSRKNKRIYIVLYGVLFFAPIIAFAALTGPLVDILATLRTILNNVAALVIGIAFVVFLWGVFKYISAASAEGKEGARAIIIYGLIGLFVMLAAWGLVNLLLVTFGFDEASTPTSTDIPRAVGPAIPRQGP